MSEGNDTITMKKPYETPKVGKVKVAGDYAVLSVCNSSPTVNATPGGCMIVNICYDTGMRHSQGGTPSPSQDVSRP